MYVYLRRLPVVAFQLDEQENMGADEGVELRHPQGGSRATPGVGGARKGEGRPCYICTVRYAGKHQGVRPLACRYVAGTDVLLFMQALTRAEASMLRRSTAKDAVHFIVEYCTARH